MAHDLDIRRFLRGASNEWLKRYFAKFGVLGEFDWTSVGVRKIEPLFDVWQGLDEALKVEMGEDFHNLNVLGSPIGKAAIIDEAQFHPGADLVAPALAALPDPLSCAFWTYFERPDLWNGAIFFSVADLKPKRYWRKRVNIPKLGRDPMREDADALGGAVSAVFMRREARGKPCSVYPYRRGGKAYYFAYPQDHRSTSSEYDEKGQWTKRPFNPTFEVIFVHDDNEQTLSIWHDAPMDRIKDLQVAFANAVLGQDIERDCPRDARVYELECFLDPRAVIAPAPDLGIAKVEVRKLSVRTLGSDQHMIRIELGRDTGAHILYQRLDAATGGISRTRLKVASVGLQVTFDQALDEELPKSRSFEVSWPNTCSLADDEPGKRIREMLVRNGIEPQKIKKADAEEDG